MVKDDQGQRRRRVDNILAPHVHGIAPTLVRVSHRRRPPEQVRDQGLALVRARAHRRLERLEQR